MPFVHLHNHSHYSLLDGAQHLETMVLRAKTLNMPGLGLTDHGNLHGARKFYAACVKHGLTPVLGYEAYVVADVNERVRGATHLTILAKNNAGWANMLKLASFASTTGFYSRPRLDRKVLEAHAEGLIILSGCIGSELSRHVLNDNLGAARETAEWYARMFGEDFYLELQCNGTAAQERALNGTLNLSELLSIPCVATADCHYTNPDDAALQDVMVCITTGQVVHAPKQAPRLEENVYYMRSEQEMREDFLGYEDAVLRTAEIAAQVNVTLETGVRHFPVFDVPIANWKGERCPHSYLRKLCYEGLLERLGKTNSGYTGRLERELEVIHGLGFDEYFLVVADFCKWARDRGIYSTARGSGVGSLVCFCLGISHVDPIEYALLFERFLDPSRREAPDIDVDFDQERRAEVMEYVKDKYGEDCACQIGTFGTFGAKMAIKDVAKVMCISSAKASQITALVPELPGTTLAIARQKVQALDEMVGQDHQSSALYNMAQRIEGMAKSIGTHAAGVVISDKPLVNYVPLMRGKDGATITQWDMGDCEDAGLLKMDFLGLRNLTILSRAVDIIEDRTGKRLDLHKLPVDDAAVYESLARGDTAGVFQLEPPGMTQLLIRMRPTHIENIIACIALYRPGPLDAGMVDEYVAVKNGERQATYAHPYMEKILGYTYGVMVYQEQVMQVLYQVGKIPLSEAYSCIKAISKKIKDKVEKYRPIFCQGCEQNGVDGAALWEQIGTFARYGFNKSHSTAYALIAYQTAWLKHYFPVEFMAALLSCDVAQRSYTGRDSLCAHLHECDLKGIEIVMPDVNVCGPDFKVRDGRILFGLDAIKGVPHSASVAIAAAQPFTDLFDFCRRVPKSECPKAAIRNLIQVGAMPVPADCHVSRAAMEATIDRAVKLAVGGYKNAAKYEGVWVDQKSRTRRAELEQERALLGVYATGHPADEHRWIGLLGSVTGRQGQVVAGGVVTTIEERLTHAGKMFTTFILDSPATVTSCIIWEPKGEIARPVQNGAIVIVRGNVGRGNSITVHSIRAPEAYLQEYRLNVCVLGSLTLGDQLVELGKQYPGDFSLYLHTEGRTFGSGIKVDITTDFVQAVYDLGATIELVETRIRETTTPITCKRSPAGVY